MTITTTPEKTPATGSSFPPGSIESKAAASPTRVVDDAFWQKMGEMMDKKLGEALKPINEKLDSVDKRFDSIDERFDSVDEKLFEALKPINEKLDNMGKLLTTVDKRTGFLVEEAARRYAVDKFGN